MTLPRAIRPFASRGYRILAIALAATVFGSGVWTVAAVLTVRALGGGPGEFSLVATGFALVPVHASARGLNWIATILHASSESTQT